MRKCPDCNLDFVPGSVRGDEWTIRVNDDLVKLKCDFNYPLDTCPKCGEYYLDGKQIREISTLVAKQYESSTPREQK